MQYITYACPLNEAILSDATCGGEKLFEGEEVDRFEGFLEAICEKFCCKVIRGSLMMQHPLLRMFASDRYKFSFRYSNMNFFSLTKTYNNTFLITCLRYEVFLLDQNWWEIQQQLLEVYKRKRTHKKPQINIQSSQFSFKIHSRGG